MVWGRDEFAAWSTYRHSWKNVETTIDYFPMTRLREDLLGKVNHSVMKPSKQDNEEYPK